jgi:hypothetical protein
MKLDLISITTTTTIITTNNKSHKQNIKRITIKLNLYY